MNCGPSLQLLLIEIGSFFHLKYWKSEMDGAKPVLQWFFNELHRTQEYLCLPNSRPGWKNAGYNL